MNTIMLLIALFSFLCHTTYQTHPKPYKAQNQSPLRFNRNYMHRQKQSKPIYVHDGSTDIICICKVITNILCPWWINKNCINRQKQSKPFYVHDRSMEIINIDNTHSQKRSKTFYVHDGSTAIIYIGKGITNISCP